MLPINNYSTKLINANRINPSYNNNIRTKMSTIDLLSRLQINHILSNMILE